MRALSPAAAALPAVLRSGALTLLALASLWPAVARAGVAEDAAVRAAEVREQHCSHLLRRDANLEAGALSVVAGALDAVGVAWKSAPEPFLLYWRGSLAQCLGYDDNARADLQAFLSATPDDGSAASQREDAVRRLRILSSGSSGERAPSRPGLGFGTGLLAGSAVWGGLAGWQFSRLQEAEAAYVAGNLRADGLAAQRTNGEDAAGATNVLLVASVGCAVASIPLFVADAVVNRKGGGPRALLVPALVPGADGGPVITLAGRW